MVARSENGDLPGRKSVKGWPVVLGQWIGYSIVAFVLIVWLRLLWGLSEWAVIAAKGIMP